MRRNCKRCTRWRPLIDYDYVVYRKGEYGERIYVRLICKHCDREQRKRRNKTVAQKEKDRINAKARREAHGAKPRQFRPATIKRRQTRLKRRNEKIRKEQGEIQVPDEAV